MGTEEKQAKSESAKTTTTPEAKPKKRHGCIIAMAVFCAIIFIIFILSQLLPFWGFWNGGDSDKSNTPAPAKNSATDDSKTTTPKKTGGSSSSTSAYSKDDYLNYFIQLATRNGSDTLGRFNKSPVYLRVEGNVPAGADETLNKVIADFNGLSDSIKIERNQNGSDIQVIFVPRSELDNYRNPPTVPNDAFEVEIPNADCSYKYAKTYIAYDVMDADTLSLTIRHELGHAIGFKGHITPSTVDSIMANRIKTDNWRALDQVMIKMLYNMGAPLCAGEASIRSFFAGWNP